METTSTVSNDILDKKKLQIRNAFIKELETTFKYFQEIEQDSVEFQSVFNIFSILKKTNPELIISPVYNDFTLKFEKKLIPEIDVEYFLNYDVENHIRSTVTTQYIFDAMIVFCKKMQVSLNKIYRNGTDHETKLVTLLGNNVQKFVKLTNLYYK